MSTVWIRMAVLKKDEDGREKIFRFLKKLEENWKTYRSRKIGLMRRTWNKTQIAILDGYCCRQDVE